jgi:hypothetical protein
MADPFFGPMLILAVLTFAVTGFAVVLILHFVRKIDR